MSQENEPDVLRPEKDKYPPMLFWSALDVLTFTIALMSGRIGLAFLMGLVVVPGLYVALVLAGGYRWLCHLWTTTWHGQYRSSWPQAGRLRKSVSKEARSSLRLPYLGSLSIVPYPLGDTVLGIFHDQKEGTYSVVIEVVTDSVSMMSDEERMERRRGYQTLEERLAERTISRVTWRAHIMPEENADPYINLRTIRQDGGIGGPLSTTVDGLVEAERQAAKKSKTSLVVFILTVPASARRNAADRQDPYSNLVAEAQWFYNQIRPEAGEGGLIGLRSCGFLTFNFLVFYLRLCFDPEASYAAWQTRHRFEEQDVTDERGFMQARLLNREAAFPMHIAAPSRDSFEIDGTTHMACTFAGLDNVVDLESALDELMTTSARSMMLSMVMQMVPYKQARKRAEKAKTNQLGSVEADQAKGKRVSDDEVVAAEEARAHSRRLAEERTVDVRLAPYVYVTGASYQQVKRNLAAVQRSAADLDVRPLFHDQVMGLRALVPGRGLVRRR